MMHFAFLFSILLSFVAMAEESPSQITAVMDECLNKIDQQSKHNSCSKKAVTNAGCAEFEEQLKGATSIESAVAFCATRKPDLIMLGETHFTEAIYILYPQILKQLKSLEPALDCLFLESDPNYQDFLNVYQNCQESVEICFQPIEDLNKRLDANPNYKGPALRIFYPALADMARTLKLKVYAVDPRNKMGISNRNLEMANAIKSKINNCRFSAMVVGSDHISATYYEELPTRKNNTAEQLRRQGVKVEGILMSAESPWEKGLKIPGCSERFPFPSNTKGMEHRFKNQIIKSLPLKVMEEVEKPSYWNQYCASILIPASK